MLSFHSRSLFHIILTLTPIFFSPLLNAEPTSPKVHWPTAPRPPFAVNLALNPSDDTTPYKLYLRSPLLDIEAEPLLNWDILPQVHNNSLTLTRPDRPDTVLSFQLFDENELITNSSWENVAAYARLIESDKYFNTFAFLNQTTPQELTTILNQNPVPIAYQATTQSQKDLRFQEFLTWIPNSQGKHHLLIIRLVTPSIRFNETLSEVSPFLRSLNPHPKT